MYGCCFHLKENPQPWRGFPKLWKETAKLRLRSSRDIAENGHVRDRHKHIPRVGGGHAGGTGPSMRYDTTEPQVLAIKFSKL